MSTATATPERLDRFSLPDARGHFGRYGGVFVPETLMTALQELGAAYEAARKDPSFQSELRHHLKEFAGRQALNVFRMRLMGAEVRGVEAGQKTLKEAINEAMRDWVTNVRATHYILGSALGSHPYPMMVRDFHRLIGQELREQILAREGRL